MLNLQVLQSFLHMCTLSFFKDQNFRALWACGGFLPISTYICSFTKYLALYDIRFITIVSHFVNHRAMFNISFAPDIYFLLLKLVILKNTEIKTIKNNLFLDFNRNVFAPGRPDCLAHTRQRFIDIVGLTALRLAFFMGYE